MEFWKNNSNSAFSPPVAQSVEQLPFKEMVAGSIPAGRTKRWILIEVELQSIVSAKFSPCGASSRRGINGKI